MVQCTGQLHAAVTDLTAIFAPAHLYPGIRQFLEACPGSKPPQPPNLASLQGDERLLKVGLVPRVDSVPDCFWHVEHAVQALVGWQAC